MIAIVTDPAVGGTFLNWSIHYLAGENEYYSAWTKQPMPLIEAPVLGRNAHEFIANQVHYLHEFNDVVTDLNCNSNDLLKVIYFHHFRHTIESKDPDTCKAVQHLDHLRAKTIFLTLSPQHVLYQCSYEKRSIVYSSDYSRILTSNREILDHFLDRYFSHSKAKWDQEKLEHVWDLREFVALNVDPFAVHTMQPMIELVNQPYVLDAVELMTVFDVAVHDLFRYLDIKLDPARYEKWLPVYLQWKRIHTRRLKFVFNYDLIVHSIVSGCNVDLERFDLDIMQEAAIQRALIYQHGLNLKTWQLEKFSNTAQLHDLLGPNFHTL